MARDLLFSLKTKDADRFYLVWLIDMVIVACTDPFSDRLERCGVSICNYPAQATLHTSQIG